AGPQPGSYLNLQRVEKRRDERVGDIRGQVDLESIEPEQPAQTYRERQMESDEWRAANVKAQADGECLPDRCVPFGPVAMERRRQAARTSRHILGFYRSATIGRIVDDRCAGVHAAERPTSTMSPAAPLIVSGSTGLTPNNRDATIRPATRTIGRPAAR